MVEETTPEGAHAPAPGAESGTAPGERAATPIPQAASEPSRWGRVDEDGSVYVYTSAGERAVGVWQAGTAAEGLLHFARRFDDLRTEVELLETRITSGSGEPKQALQSATHLRGRITETAAVGDIDALHARIEEVVAHAEQAVQSARQQREQHRTAAIERKQALAAEAEEISAESTQWKQAGDRLRKILDEWKSIKGIDRKTDDELWKRFSKARERFNRRRGSHFAELDKQRATAKERKEELAAEADSLTDSTDWGPTAARYKELMAEWKAAGRAPKEADEALWQRFRAAQDTFFANRSAAFSERDAELAENARRKEELLTEAERIDPDADSEDAKTQLRRIQQRWDEIGKVPRERMRELDGRLRAVQDRVRSAQDRQWRRTDPEVQARAEQFRERVRQFRTQAEKARAGGDEKKAAEAEQQAEQWQQWLHAAEDAVEDR